MQDAKYDVFLSFTGDDREAVRALAEELRGRGARVFFDDVDIDHHTGITAAILDGLRSSRVFVPFYSADYARRPCCQQELLEVFLAGLADGDPCRRILVVNPEEGADHLRPIELADARFTRWGGDVAEWPGIAEHIVKRALDVPGVIGAHVGAAAPGWPGRGAARHMERFAGRHTELWDLHSALHRERFQMASEADFGGIAALRGLPGSGKSAVATAYALRFRSAFPGGVEWLSLAGATPDPRGLRRRLAGVRAPADGLVIVDDIPTAVGADLVDCLPPRWAARVVLISEADVFDRLLPVVPVGGLPARWAGVLLDGFREPDDAVDAEARDRLVEVLGGNPGALVAVGEYLADRQGLASYGSVLREIGWGSTFAETMFAPVRRVLDQMSARELEVVRGAAFAMRAAAPVVELVGADPFAVGTVLKRLRVLGAATRDGSTWCIDPFVLRGAEVFHGRSAAAHRVWGACGYDDSLMVDACG